MSKVEDQHDSKRRAFLRGGAMLGAGATLAATTPAVAAPAAEAVTPEQQTKPEQKGYQLTEHVAAYYRNAAS